MFDRHPAVNVKGTGTASFPRVRHSQVLHVVLFPELEGLLSMTGTSMPLTFIWGF